MTPSLILLGPLPPPFGGVSIFLKNLFLHLRKRDIRVWSYCGTLPDEKVSKFNHRRLGIVPLLFRHGRRARIVDFSHFHVEYPNSILLPVWLFAKVVLRFNWCKYILDGSLPVRFTQFSKVRRLLFQRAIKSVNEFIVVSDELAKWLRQNGAVQPIAVVPCLVNIPDEVLSQALTDAIGGQLQSFLEHEKRVCSVGTFIASYGFDQIANVVEFLREELKEDIGLVLLDGGFANDDGYRAAVLTDRPWITVLADVANTDVYHILKRCHLFVRGVSAEGFGISRIEAIWCGIPVVATKVGETRGMMTYEFGDEKQLKSLVREALCHKPKPETSIAQSFHDEADRNLQKFIKTVGLS